MKLLLDTHIFLWSLLDPARLRAEVVDQLKNPANELWLSPITVWEVMMLAEKKRIVLDDQPVNWVQRVLRQIPFHQAALTHEVAIQSHEVSLPHRDPADRFLAATARVYDLTLVTADKHLLASPVCKTLPNR